MHLYSSLRAYTALVLEDRADIERSIPVKLPNGSTVMRYTTVASQIRCRLSRVASRRDDIDNMPPRIEINCEACLFCDPEHEILSGDRIVVFRNGKPDASRIYIAGEPFSYQSHLEIPLERSTDA